MGVGVGLSIAVGAISAGAEANLQNTAADNEIQQIDIQNKEAEVKNQQKTIRTYDNLKEALSSQIAQASSRGFSLSSPSFQAVQINALNDASKDRQNEKLEMKLENSKFDMERDNVKKTLHAQFIGDFSNLGNSVSNAISKIPTKD